MALSASKDEISVAVFSSLVDTSTCEGLLDVECGLYVAGGKWCVIRSGLSRPELASQ